MMRWPSSNPVTHLTRQQLEAIFRGKVTNWNQVKDPYTGKRGPDLKIVVYSRETSSGTYEFFKTSVLREKNYMAGVLSMPATGAVIRHTVGEPDQGSHRLRGHGLCQRQGEGREGVL